MAGFFSADPVVLIQISLAIGAVITLLSIMFGNKLSQASKTTFFVILTIPILLSSLYLGIHTVHENLQSETKGPVHWHVDYQIWVCGERLDLINPTGLRNKIGSPLFHEHNDDRIHIEGTVMSLEDVDLESYFRVIGGYLTETTFSYIDEEKGEVAVKNGDLCNGVPSELTVYINGKRQTDAIYDLPYPSALVPPGDCVIVEFGPNNEQTTDRLCESWQAKEWDYNNYEQNREEKNY